MTAHIARPIAPHALLREIERAFCEPIAIRSDPWRRDLFEEWASRLGADRMRGFLLNLRDQLVTLADLAADGEADRLHRLAHDCASTSGMLGFLEVTRCCRELLEGDASDERDARAALQASLDDAVDCLDHHFASERRGVA